MFMTKNISLFLMCVFVSSLSFGQGISFFDGSWEETLAKAKEEEKLIFVDAYTTWCGPCKKMAKDVFTLEKVGSVFNEKFINAKINMEDEKNMSFISKYPVSAYPTLFFINGEGKIIHKKVGGQQADGLLAFAKEAEQKDDRSVNFVKEYEAGKRDHDFVIGYIKALNQANKSSLKVSNEYIKNNPNLSDEQMNEFLVEAVTEADSKLFEKMMDRKEKMIGSFGEERIQLLVKKATEKTIRKSIEFEIMDLTVEAINKFGAFHSKDETKEFEMLSNIRYYKGTGQKTNYFESSAKYFKKFAKKDNEKLTKCINQLSDYASDQKAKELILDMSKQMVKNESTWKNLLTYSNALTINEQHAKALEMAEKALEKTDNAKEKKAIERLINGLNSKV